MITTFAIGEAKIYILNIAKVQREFDQMSAIFPFVEKVELKEAIQAVQPGGLGKYLGWCFNLVLIRSPDHTILVDTGFGFTGGGPGSGTAQLLGECGLGPQEVNTIVISHGHGDHIGGLTEDGAPAMPDARVVISREEFDFWMEGQAGHVFGAEGTSAQQTALSICRNQIECIDMDSAITEATDTSIRALPAPGHTPGHIGIEVHSGGQRLWLLVDTMHAPFQLEHPDWSPRFDVDPDRARTTRRDLLSRAAEQRIPVHLYHFPFPGVGTIGKANNTYTFQSTGKR